VIVTDGARGASAWTTAIHVSVPAEPVEVVDTVGAGDAFQAALLWQLEVQGISTRSRLTALDADALRSLLAVAARAAAITAARRGADLPRAAELG
jgi:fructokinase